jgi:hypothetical protein
MPTIASANFGSALAGDDGAKSPTLMVAAKAASANFERFILRGSNGISVSFLSLRNPSGT